MRFDGWDTASPQMYLAVYDVHFELPVASTMLGMRSPIDGSLSIIDY